VRGVGEAGGRFCPGGGLPVSFGVGPPAGWFPCDAGWPGVGDGLGAIRFGGFRFGALGAGDCFDSGELDGVSFPPGPFGEPSVVAGGFTVGEPLVVPEGFPPSRFGGAGFFPAAGTFDEALGVTFAFGALAPGFTKLGDVFCPATAVGEPVATGDPAAAGDAVTCPLLTICGFTRGVGFGRSFGAGF
jgi:hypothetical protein